jgi:hypothetical protein
MKFSRKTFKKNKTELCFYERGIINPKGFENL